MYNNFQNDKELQRKYKHLYEIEVGSASNHNIIEISRESNGTISLKTT